jgi:alpha-L-fucosidase 2
VKGLRARGDYTVDIRWQDGELAEAVVHAGERSAGKVRAVYRGKAKMLEIKPGETATIAGD